MAERVEKDGVGEVRLNDDAYYGINTARAIDNFRVSGIRVPTGIVRAAARVKSFYAKANLEASLLDGNKAEAIRSSCREITEGKFDDSFPLDIFQTGSGTSTNMNVNEVIANRATEILGGKKGDRSIVHPNDDVNMGQSSNDVFPSAIQLALLLSFRDGLIPSLEKLRVSLEGRSIRFREIVKAGRTHLMDALPVTLGQEFAAYASQIDHSSLSVRACFAELSALPLGGTAVGTGFGTDPKIPLRAIELLSEETGLDLRQQQNLFEGLGSKDSLLGASGAMKRTAASMAKIAEDIRLMATGPRCGLGELILPSLQAGSSIMAGKVNPVMPEMVLMVSAQVAGFDAANTICAMGGRLELNTMMPLLGYNLLTASGILSNAAFLFAEKCVEGIEADIRKCRIHAENSPSLVTALQPVLGYDRASELYKESISRDVPIRKVILEKNLLTEDEIDRLFDPARFTDSR
ncbi:MAG TPA: class II fumarate hydratase [Acidobacteriota bacterium]|nr:class II fumarate hydratase [Acidobacteriota bacterium]HQQ47538.1 class II fumarate hydratase [Acidobacteriota bacterium]